MDATHREMRILNRNTRAKKARDEFMKKYRNESNSFSSFNEVSQPTPRTDLVDIVRHKTDNKIDTVDNTLDKDIDDMIVVHETTHKENTKKKRRQNFSSDEDLSDPNYEPSKNIPSPNKSNRILRAKSNVNYADYTDKREFFSRHC